MDLNIDITANYFTLSSLTDRKTDRQTGDGGKCAPVRLCFLQEVHLVLHAGTGFEFLHHHLSGI